MRYCFASRRATAVRVVSLILIGASYMSCATAPNLRAAENPPANLTTDQVIDGLVSSIEAFRQLPGLELDYRKTVKVVNPHSDAIWPWEQMDVTNAIKPSQPGKIYVHIQYQALDGNGRPMKRNDGKPILIIKERSSDGEFFAHMTPVPAGRRGRTRASIASVQKQGFTGLENYCSYFRYVGYPVSDDPDAGQALRRVYPAGDYWLPNALTTNRTRYHIAPHLEQVGGIWCHVLKRPGLDTIWAQTEPAFIIRRRLFHWGQDQLIRQDIVMDMFQELAPGVHWPRQVTYHMYAAPWDSPNLANQVISRMDIDVTRMEILNLPDSCFRLKIPAGAQVADIVNGTAEDPIIFTNRPGEDPFEVAATGLRTRSPSPRVWHWVLWIGAAVITAITILWFLRRH